MIPTAVRVPAPTEPAPAPASRWPAVLALGFGAAVTGIWAAAAVLAAGHGFDTTDEGFYLLSYRWWDVDHRNFTGAAYLYGPVFSLLGHDVAGLRLVRLGTVLVAHALFGLAFMCWLRARRPDAPPTRLWEAAGTMVIVAAGGAVYGWLPATPGYNDPVLLGGLLVLAVICHGERRWLPFAAGAVLVPMMLAKWAALPLVLLLLVPLARALPRVLAGALAAVAVLHLTVVPLTTALPPLIAVNRLLADGSMSVPVLLERYWTTSLPMLGTALLRYGPLLLGGIALARARRPIPVAAARLLALAGFGLAVWHAARGGGGLGGGAIHVLGYAVPLLAVVLYAVGTGLAAGRATGPPRDWWLLGLLVVFPMVYALGTGNIPLKVAVNAFAVWMAVLVAVLTGTRRGRTLTAAVAASALVATACVATGGLWRHPYRGVPRGQATAVAAGVPALDSVRLDPAAAAWYAALRARLAPWVEPAGRAIIGFDKMAGVVFLLDGRSVGELWYAANDRDRSATGIAAACARDPWWGERLPILIFDRPVYRADRAVLARCGLRIDENYRLLPDTGELTVYLPR